MDPKTETDLAEKTPTSGARLREAREARELELRDVATFTRQSQDTLAALEAMSTDAISPTILRMQARTYARFLELPEDEIVEGFAGARSQLNASAMPEEVLKANSFTRKKLLVGSAIAAVVIAAAMIATWAMRPNVATDSGDLAISARLAPQANRQQMVRTVGTDRKVELAIVANRAGWIEVRGSDGTIFRSRTMSAGEVYYPRMQSGWTVTVRDAGAFEWQLDQQPVGALGADGTAVYSVSVDEATTRGIEELSRAMAESEAGAASSR
ncbi:MAG: helix-turn-helix domain-containing protein [Henriciella sp.]|nr:helix-turn-helix domain-containing protein [Henriciella sp.]